ncbi:MAG: hypothetical protein BGO31_00050 [Bacteroidetes bacterium 43-16]|uniref:DUF3127 domain-containing protein n=1 Tax=uncultured Dysgonomonas sp. TaxID=206096 RepID=UPI000928A7A1|nr:DUF3127 domain-containing protein [uncultured Dysgonomonas sp.]OJV51630.1 MAG: hypothetical protein BGO31_00050 [Bacteroidetes bacterium 43-16]
MSNQVTGKIYRIDQPVQRTQTFSHRNFILDVSETNNGQTYPNFIMLQLVNNNTSLIDQYKVGDVIKVSYNLRGSLFNGQQGETVITNINAWKIEPVQVQQQQYAPPAQQYAAPAPQQQQYNQPAQQQVPQQQWTPPAAPPAQQAQPQYGQPQQQQQWTPPAPPAQQQQPNFNPQNPGQLPF